MIGKLLLAFWILRWTSFFDPVAGQGFSSFDEGQDEMNDMEIFRAVVESMRQWTLRRMFHHRGKREVSKVCYEDIGCFEDTGPFSYLEMLPSPPKDVGTRFFVYGSRKARSIPMEVPADDINDKANRAIDPDLPTKVIVHGFGSDCNHLWVYDMRSALMSIHDCNIVCVDWSPGSAVPNYVRAAANTRLVGRQLAKLIRSLNVPMERVHLIGFSLGAHVAGFAGAELGNVSRITGLDPAGPLFESQDPRARLDATDANFVDVIHSNGEQLILGGLGSWQPMGDVDYYPNGGKMQSGCSNLFFGAVTDIIWSSAVEGKSLCNHRRAYKLFTDSVSPKCRFPAFPCDNGYEGLLRGDCFPCNINGVDRPCGEMGYYSNESPARGQLYLITRDEEPFCAHQHQIKVYNSRSERSVRSYGKLQITFVGEGSYNDTFAMTRKDEELLVGSILQKIVVLHPAVSTPEGIEIMYTAYSGWISSGLVSWTIDKVTILDSFGKTMSVCKKGLILESGRSVYLPLYPGECNIPLDADNSTSSSPVPPPLEPMVEENKQSQQQQQLQQSGGIGPFTKSHNYEPNDGYSMEVSPPEKSVQRKGLGPFTKEQNLRIPDDVEASFGVTSGFEEAVSRRGTVATNPWIVLDISGDGDSNSLENTELESGRGFSGGSNLIYRTSTPVEHVVETTTGTATTEYLPEIREPVLRPSKKESGRSLKLPEITEPILRPRATRQNTRNEAVPNERQHDEIQETSSTSTRTFTVQLFPERLAKILGRVEQYARQNLWPLISQYTPSFVTGSKNEEPKYFPLLSDMLRSRSTTTTTTESTKTIIRQRNDHITRVNISRRKSEEAPNPEHSSSSNTRPVNNEAPMIVEAVYPEKTSAISIISKTSGNISGHEARTARREESDWRPIGEPTTVSSESGSARRFLNASRALNWPVDHSQDWVSRAEGQSAKTDDWVPIAVKSDVTTARSVASSEETPVIKDSEVAEKKSAESEVSVEVNPKIATYERKFIPLIDLEEISGPSLADFNDVPESRSSTTTVATHIQKIPRRKEARAKSGRTLVRSTMMFPYAYERRNDPKTRYIPLIPEEDMGRSYSFMERKR